MVNGVKRYFFFLEGMDAANQGDHIAPSEFHEYVKDPLIELSPTDSKELWLIQWPMNQAPDFDGQELSLKLHHDGLLGSFEGSSGKSYDVVNFNAQDPDATVFLSSALESQIVGKISRRVQLIHYPDPSELEKQNTNKHKQMSQRSSATSLTNSSHHRATPSKSVGPKSSHSAGTSMRSSKSKSSNKSKSSMSEVGEPSEPPKKRHIKEPTVSREQSTQDSGRGHSAVTSSGSVEHSNENISRKKKKHV